MTHRPPTPATNTRKPPRHRRATANRAFTLIEAITTIVALSIIAATIAPILQAAADSYAAAVHHRATSQRLAHAITRITRAIHEIPTTDHDPSPHITLATTSALAWADGHRIEHDPTTATLLLTQPPHAPAILANGVTNFTLRYLDPAGLTIDTQQPDSLHLIRRIELAITIDAIEARAAATIRPGLGQH